jgi:hypothetical protein
MLASVVRSRLAATNPVYQKLISEVDAACENIETAKEQQDKTDPKIAQLKDRLEKVNADLERIEADDSRREEISSKSREQRSLIRKRNELRAKNPAVLLAESRHLEAVEKADRYFRQAIAVTDSPEARALVRLLAARDAAPKDASGGVTAADAPKRNLFSDLYDNLDHAYWSADYKRDYAAYLERNIKREHPEADPRKIELWVKWRTGFIQNFPADEPVETTVAANPVDEIFRLFNLFQKKKMDAGEMSKQIRRAQLDLGPAEITRVDSSQLIRNVSTGENRKVQRGVFIRDLLYFARNGHPLAADDYVFFYSTLSNNCDDEDWIRLDEFFTKQPNRPVDPWLRTMIAGRAAIARAWNARGGGYANTVTRNGWKIFAEELGKARTALLKARELYPDRVNQDLQLISVEMGDGNVMDRVKVFKRIIRLQPDVVDAYQKIAWALMPRWCGSHEWILDISDAAIDTERIDTPIPYIGFELIGQVVWDYPDYRWKNLYRRPGLAEKVDKHYVRKLEENGGNVEYEQFVYMHRMLFEMATLRYDRALETRRKINLSDEEFSRRCLQWGWRGRSIDGDLSRVPMYMDPVMELALFTGVQKEPLRAMEREYLDGDGEQACRALSEAIQSGDWSTAERNFLVDLYGRWRLPEGGQSYYDCNDNAILFNSFQVAAATGRGDVAKEMIKLKFDYGRMESYPGETAIRAARRGSDPALFDVLKAAGDPLDRPEPQHGRTPIHVACFVPNAVMVKKLLELGASPNAPDRENHAPIHFGATSGGAEVVELLIAAGADVDVPDNDGDVALMLAIQNHRRRPVWEPLVKSSKQLNHRYKGGRTVLHYAAEYGGDPALVKMLIERGADPGVADNAGQTPIMVAVSKGRGDLAALMNSPSIRAEGASDLPKRP